MTTESAGGRTYKFGVGDRLRVAREVAGLSQDELAQLTGISRQTISNYELGASRKPKPPYIAAIALATHFNRDWIEHGTEPEPDGGGEPLRAAPSQRPTQGWAGMQALLQIAA
jgi:transcriptional regulator with XRE-family HTH domain